ncbi:hypothetical protein, partial [Bradyrhizobium ivorense]|uniref:hypothetical protein n=1 Tax=Bradyrhizobium ivorense TaxID=2511166 RepID=UPI001E5D7F3C
EFDGRMNRKLLGTRWAIRHSDRIWAFWFLEKPNANPHWHGLVRFFPADGRPIPDQMTRFDREAEGIWRTLVPGGTVDIQEITAQRGVIDYVCKMIGHPLSYEHFITPDEFVRG